MWKEYTNALLGAVIAVVSFIGMSAASLTWALAILGFVVLGLALWDAHGWEDYTSAVLGLVVAAVPFIGLTDLTFVWTLGILGAVIVVLSLWTAGTISAPSPSQQSHA